MNSSGLWPETWYNLSTVQSEALANPLENLASPDGGGTPVGRAISPFPTCLFSTVFLSLSIPTRVSKADDLSGLAAVNE